MTFHPAGSTVSYHVTWLEMTERPGYGWPVQPAAHEAALLCAETPPVWYFMCLYDAVGRDYAWEDLHTADADTMEGWLASEDVELWTLMRRGWPHGFFVLDWTEAGRCELSYFGLVPQAVGRGFGRFLLRTAVLTGWDRPGVTRMTVNTCSLDHPRALVEYQKAGFEVVAQEERSRVLRRDFDPARIPD
ncbi:hypothetical protein C2I36_02105 [Rhodobacteraceae bacterium WD3A24]|nr:hypothetical protein C2I36_02105 [Rhodobacteraceae bacterium WD3A24]